MSKYDNLNKFSIKIMKDETWDVAIEEFVELRRKMYSFLVDNNEHKKTKSVRKNAVAKVSHMNIKIVLLNRNCIRHSVNRIRSKDHRIGTYEINKISLSCFDEKNIYPKQWIWEMSTWLLKLIRKKSTTI